MESSFRDYYDDCLKAPLPRYIFHRECIDLGLAWVDAVNVQSVSDIDTKYCFILVDGMWKRAETSNAKMVMGNKKAFSDKGYYKLVNNLYLFNHKYSIIKNLQTGEVEFTKEQATTDKIIKGQSLIGNDKELLVFRNELNSNLSKLGFHNYLSKEFVSDEIIKAIQGGQYE